MNINIIEKINILESPLKEILYEFANEIEKNKEKAITRNELNELKTIVKEILIAQQKNIEELKLLTGTVKGNRKAIEENLEEIKEVRKITEENREEIKEVRKITEENREGIKEVRKITEENREETKENRKAIEDIRKQMGGLSNHAGYDLENKAYKALPELLKRDFNVELKNRLIRKFITYSTGRREQINIFGKALKAGHKEVYIIGECKIDIGKKDIADFKKTVKRVENHLRKEVISIMIAHSIDPDTEELLKENNMKYYFSYEF